MGPTASSHPTPQLAEPPPAGVARPPGSAPLDWPATGRHAGDTARAISTQIVALVREHTGRAPTKAKAIISPDLVVVSLADWPHDSRATRRRRGPQRTHHAHARGLASGDGSRSQAIVEELTHKSVTAYLTAQHHDPDLAILVFYLAA